MPILFTAIAHGTTILAKYASYVGNFIEVTEQVIEKIPAENNMMTYAHLNYFFHYLMEESLVYLCITDDDFEQAKAFLFLSDIKTRFEKKYGATWIRVALPNNAMNSDFSPVLAAQMKRYSGSWDLEEFQEQVDEVKNIMVENIENILSRGEHLDLLVKESENRNAVVKAAEQAPTGEAVNKATTGERASAAADGTGNGEAPAPS
ncbi:Vesicle-associated membrane protein 7 [Orchesella cincta]|uniref:Vesicle-associated membrane protein 7 n=1 Tax=Orchesella cincta TaxID=48709 RepID=A0A1D2MDS6_ORCCI|nr:Vesicle-associated membrane protein 7 [Orchesella cincta]